MCYTTDEYVKPKTEVTYNPKFPYGINGYRTNCNNIPVSQFKINNREPVEGLSIESSPILRYVYSIQTNKKQRKFSGEL